MHLEKEDNRSGDYKSTKTIWIVNIGEWKSSPSPDDRRAHEGRKYTRPCIHKQSRDNSTTTVMSIRDGGLGF